jgi:hypothetical protein
MTYGWERDARYQGEEVGRRKNEGGTGKTERQKSSDHRSQRKGGKNWEEKKTRGTWRGMQKDTSSNT